MGRFRLRSTAHLATEWNPRPNIQQSRCLQEDDLRNKPIMHERWHHSSTVPHTPRRMSQPWLLVGNCCARTRASVGPPCAAHSRNSIIAVPVSHTQSISKSQLYPYSVSTIEMFTPIHQYKQQIFMYHIVQSLMVYYANEVYYLLGNCLVLDF